MIKRLLIDALLMLLLVGVLVLPISAVGWSTVDTNSEVLSIQDHREQVQNIMLDEVEETSETTQQTVEDKSLKL